MAQSSALLQEFESLLATLKQKRLETAQAVEKSVACKKDLHAFMAAAERELHSLKQSHMHACDSLRLEMAEIRTDWHAQKKKLRNSSV